MPHTQIGLSVLLCALLGACSKKTTETEPAPEVVPDPVVVVETPEPAATPAPVPPVTKRLAPEGTFFLLVKKSAETPDGIFGFKPGTLVKQEADGSFTAEGHKLDVQPNEITNDLDIASHYAGADAQRQTALRQAAAIAAATTPPPSTQASGSTNRSSSVPPRSSSSSSSSSGGTVSATRRTAGGLESSSALGAGHTKTQDGWLWQKDTAGNWYRVRPLR